MNCLRRWWDQGDCVETGLVEHEMQQLVDDDVDGDGGMVVDEDHWNEQMKKVKRRKRKKYIEVHCDVPSYQNQNQEGERILGKHSY
jgi:tRNA G37 N-methylase TrmD